jgi:hypothetical protein
MSESEGVEGEPAGGWRRRRLTLAPRPWGSKALGEEEATVSKFVYADSDKSGGETARSCGELSVEMCSSIGSSSDILMDFKQREKGSRFWALDDDVSSDEESPPEELASSGVVCGLSSSGSNDEEGVREASAVGEMLLTSSRSECSTRTEKSSRVHPKLMPRRQKSGKPWKGPLPPARQVQLKSLGDFWALDYRSGSGGVPVKLAELQGKQCSSPPHKGSPALEQPVRVRLDPDVDFEFRIPVTLQHPGPASLLGQRKNFGRPKQFFHFHKA